MTQDEYNERVRLVELSYQTGAITNQERERQLVYLMLAYTAAVRYYN